jgi:uncharacterized protein
MESKLLHAQDGQRTFAIVLKTGEEVFGSLSGFAKRERISAAQLTAIGALNDVELKYFDWEKKKYETIPVREQVEVASLIGDVALSPEGEPALHAHVVLDPRGGGQRAA